MGVLIEFNWVLALRPNNDSNRRVRDISELLPSELVSGKLYSFRKSGFRIYPLDQTMALCETQGSNRLSDPLAFVMVREYTHKREGGKDVTEGKYLVERKPTREDLSNLGDCGLWAPRQP
ncbi:MAG: hypothetical protein AABX12_05155 [Nanoarchaeota archaeon]